MIKQGASVPIADLTTPPDDHDNYAKSRRLAGTRSRCSSRHVRFTLFFQVFFADDGCHAPVSRRHCLEVDAGVYGLPLTATQHLSRRLRNAREFEQTTTHKSERLQFSASQRRNTAKRRKLPKETAGRSTAGLTTTQRRRPWKNQEAAKPKPPAPRNGASRPPRQKGRVWLLKISRAGSNTHVTSQPARR